MCSVEVNDIFEQMVNENKRLNCELIFANKCLKILIEFKDRLIGKLTEEERYESGYRVLFSGDINKFIDLNKQFMRLVENNGSEEMENKEKIEDVEEKQEEEDQQREERPEQPREEQGDGDEDEDVDVVGLDEEEIISFQKDNSSDTIICDLESDHCRSGWSSTTEVNGDNNKMSRDEMSQSEDTSNLVNTLDSRDRSPPSSQRSPSVEPSLSTEYITSSPTTSELTKVFEFESDSNITEDTNDCSNISSEERFRLMLSQSNDKFFVCNVNDCHKVFRSEVYFYYHKQKHLTPGVRQVFTCDFQGCLRSFKSQQGVKCHQGKCHKIGKKSYN